MWRLRQNVLYNKHYFFKEILFFVIGFHTIFLCLMCLVDTTQLQSERFVLDAQKLQSTVVFMPLHKKVAIKNQSSSGEHTSQKKLLNHDEYLALQKKETKSAGKQEKNKKKETSKNKKSEQKKEPIVGKTDKKEKKKNPPAETKKVAPKVEKKSPTLALPEKKVVERKELVEKKPLPQVAAKELQQEEPKQEALVHQPVALPVFQAEPIVEPVTEQEKDGEEDELVLNEDEISFVGRVDLELIQIKEMIHGQVAKFYKPPVGISKKAVCELSVCVGLSGKADRVVVEKSSGSVANDACARAALLQVTFPKEVIGKKIIIELGQS